MTKIAVMGVGAIGGSLGGFMAEAGEDVTFIDPWRDSVETMRRRGLQLGGSTGDHTVPINVIHTDELSQLEGTFDVVLIAVKSYDTPWATKLMLPYMREDTWVVSPQNGINELQIAPIVGADRMVGCVTTISASMMEMADVKRTDSTSQGLAAKPVCFKVGELDGRTTPRVERLAELFEPAGNTVVTNDLWGERWTKMALNCIVNPSSAMTHLPSYDMRVHDGARKMMLKFGAEAIRVGRALGYNVASPIGNFSLEDIEQAAYGDHAELETAFVGQPQKFPGWPSMAQDVIKGRKTEIDYLNGYVAQEGRRIGIRTPYNDAAVAVIKGVEAGEFEPGVANVDRVNRMARA
ncbi:MAG: 2-dehydropantoate 2-reductase [Chloroflexi bacterium]|nr:2-dehydropantoate 2-reductase [Chloroflexota bacterium]MDA1228419.1 2-dehydropantoate 2-reductase [Chloroflexota bacterium]